MSNVGNPSPDGKALPMPSRRTPLGDAALLYARARLRVLPLRPRSKEPFSKAEMGVDAAYPGGHHLASANLATVAGWWHRWPEANIGIVPGAAALLAVDIDGPDAEREAGCLGLLAEPGPRAYSGREGGLHLYCQHPCPGREIGNWSLAPGVELRGDCGYIVAPPSLHPNGRPYLWHRDAYRSPLPLPPALQLRIREMVAGEIMATRTRATPTERTGPERRGLGFARWEAVRILHEGYRNEYLTSLAGRLRWEGRTLDQVGRELHRHNAFLCEPRLPEAEVNRIVASSARWGRGRGRRGLR